MSKVYITGISGVGKSSVAEELSKLGIRAIDIDAVPGLCRWKNKKTGERADYQYGIGREWLEAHDYFCDSNKLKKMINESGAAVAVFGVASNQQEYWDCFDKIILLRCKEETFIHRLSTRSGDNEFARTPDEQKHILSWYKEYEDDMIKKGAIAINTEDPLPVVVDKVIREIQGEA